MTIHLRQVSMSYGNQAVFEDITCSFRKNSITALLGPSGSGKSTLLRTLCRLNDRIPGFKIQGEVRILGQEIHQPEVNVYELRKKVGMVFQKPCIFPKTILENVLFGLKYHSPERHKEFPDLAQQALVSAGLWREVKDRLQDSAPTLSQGQQQRLAIARTLAVQPEILLMDEPTSSLDPKATHAIEELMLSLKADHTLVLVTHNLAQAERVSDDMICVDQGGICEQGTSRNFFGDPSQEATRRYLRERGAP
ncbi:MAG: phosphate ABC transporter ATP-binding protein [Nitrospina sp.]|nr:MAG: phosphate ABC transporter ATP-binding protein [Nitrospina sp.]